MNPRSVPPHASRIEHLGFYVSWRDDAGTTHGLDIGPYCVDYAWPWWTPGKDNPLPNLHLARTIDHASLSVITRRKRKKIHA